ncbi:NAD(P)/FAD-dependent oxidoreductase, partial [Pseudomonas aeruginosa]
LLVISDSPEHNYKLPCMYVPFEQFFLEVLTRPQRSLLRPEVMYQLDRVDRFDFAREVLQSRSGRRHGYDYLVFATAW